MRLLRTAADLIAEGQPVLVSVYPSLLPKYGHPDPWADLVTPLGVEADTGHVIFEMVSVGDGETRTFGGQVVRAFAAEHLICSAVHGQTTFFPFPVPIRPGQGSASAVPIASVMPSPDRWLEDDWMLNPELLDAPTETQRIADPVPILAAVERPHPSGSGTQRCLVVGSGGWMLSYALDEVTDIGGGRRALVNPGNQELMLASVAWLAGLDDLIAPSAISQQVARLDGVTPRVQAAWLALTVLGLPVLCIGLSIVVWILRRM